MGLLETRAHPQPKSLSQWVARPLSLINLWISSQFFHVGLLPSPALIILHIGEKPAQQFPPILDYMEDFEPAFLLPDSDTNC